MKRVGLYNMGAAILLTLPLLAIRSPFLLITAMIGVTAVLVFLRSRFSLKPAPILVGFLSLSALAAPVLSIHPPGILPDADHLFHPLGMDRLGRDIYARLLYGNRNTLFIAGSGSLLACGLGFLTTSLFALGPKYLRRAFDAILQAVLSVPLLIYFLVILSFVSPGPTSLILMFGCTLWPEIARIIQARVYQLENADFVNAARMQGEGEIAIFFREILPNLGPILTANFLVTLSATVTLEAILGFLGLGLEPGAPSMGRLIQLGLQYLDHQPHILIVSTTVLLLWLGSLRLMFRSFHVRDLPLHVP